ncbi:isochorismatase family protein [Paremcibacter congregatus]|uniref:isochorismatase family protein n=1 Tax=Paremcibacter congregatus TaxID=2043170 RepID=UPI003A918CC0
MDCINKELDELPFLPLRPRDTMMIIVDPQECFLKTMNPDDRAGLEHRLVSLCRAARKVRVPIAVSLIGGHGTKAWPHWLDDDPDIHVCRRVTANPWDDKQLREHIAKLHLPYIVLVGFWGEISLSMMALSALREGHDVYMVLDCCPNFDKPVLANQLEYLIRNTLAPVTWRQVIFEWARHEPLILTEKLLRDMLGDNADCPELISALKAPE